MMNPFQSMDSVFSTWMQTQKQIMENWTQMMQVATPSDSQNSVAPIIAQQMMSTQAMSLRLWETLMQSWQAMMTNPAQGFQEQVNRVRDEVREAMTDGIKVSGDMSDMWQSYLDQMQSWMMPWMQAANASAEHVPAMLQGDPTAYQEAANLYFEAYETTLGSMLHAPGIGLSRELDEKIRRSFAAWVDAQEAAYAYQVMLADGWAKAYAQFMEQLTDETTSDQRPTTVKDFINRWSALADEVFKDIFRSDQFVETQGRYMTAMMTLRIKQRDLTEAFLRSTDMPTRSELDETHRRVYELSREVKSLRRELAALKEDSPAPKKKTTRRSKKAPAKSTESTESDEG